MAAVPDSELATYLQEQGLEDLAYWLPKFEDIGVKSINTLTSIKKSKHAYATLAKHTRKKNLVEVQALQNIFNIDLEKEKLELHKEVETAQQKLQNEDETRVKMSKLHAQRFEKLDTKSAERLQASFSPSNKWSDEVIAQHDEVLKASGKLQPREWLDDKSVIRNASGGKALQGILLTKDLQDQLKVRSRLLEVPKDVILYNVSRSQDDYDHFMSKHEEEEYTKKFEMLGSGFTVSASGPVYGSVAISAGVSQSTKTEEEKMHSASKSVVYISTVRHSTVQVKSYTFENSQFILSEDAKADLKDILRICQQQGSSSANVQTSCRKFFNKYGSHVNEGPLTFGGKFDLICFSTGVSTTEVNTVKQQQIESISSELGLSAGGFGVSAGTSSDEAKGSTNGKSSTDSNTNTHLRRSNFGGPTEVSDITKWKEGLEANNSTWALINRGTKLKAVWDIARMNHKVELGEIVDILRKVWEEMTGLKAEVNEQEILIFDSRVVLKEVSEWNTQTLSPCRIIDNLKHLHSVKQDIIKSTAKRTIWIKEYLSQQPLQEFFKLRIMSLGTIQPASEADLQLVKSCMQQLIEKEDLSLLTSQNFPDIYQVSQWLCDKDEHPEINNMHTVCIDFESFDQYLEEKVRNEELAFLSGSKPMQGMPISPSLAQDVSVQLNHLRSHYQNTYEDVLVTILVHPFQAENRDNLIILKPMSINDVEKLRKQFSENKSNFNVYANKKKPRQLQAYLFSLAIQVCQKSEEVQFLQDVEEMMSDVDSLLKHELHSYIQHPIRSDFKQTLQSFMTSRVADPISQHSPSLSFDHSLLKVLETEACEYNFNTVIQSDIFESNPVGHTLFKKLGLCDYYCNKLRLQDALCISPKVLRLSPNEHISSKCVPIDLKQLPLLILHKIMTYDCSCRSDLMPRDDINVIEVDESSDCETFGENSDESSDESGDESLTKVVNAGHNRINPVDGLLALLLCSDDFLRQDLFSRLAKCQLAVPFLLPDPFTKKLILPLWAMRSIVMQWKCLTDRQATEEYELPLINFEMPIVSFVRFGSHQRGGTSKSKLLNDVISDSQHNHYFHHDCHGGEIELQLGKGLVDICWYLPSGKHTDMFQRPIAFLNLHGDAQLSEYNDQVRFLSRISSMCFALVTEEELKLKVDTIDILRTFSSSPGGLTILKDVKIPKLGLKKANIKTSVITLSGMNADVRKDTIRKWMKKRLQSVDKFKTILEACCDNSKENSIHIDEDNKPCACGLQLADEVIQMVTEFDDEHLSLKEAMLPLQGKTLWQAWAKNDKEASRQVWRGNKKVEDYSSFIWGKKKEIREKQSEYVKCLTPVMESFMVSLLKVRGPSNRDVRNYFLQYLKLGLNDISREKITDLQYQYQAVRKQLTEVQAKKFPSDGKMSGDTETDNNDKVCQYKQEMETLQNDIISASFGLEHLFRELGQLFEAAHDQEFSKYGEQLAFLTKVVAELLTEGYPLEIMDGDAAHVPLGWISAVIEQITSMKNDPKVYVLSVLGLQSTGKSTMLNTTFGLQFNVSAGRCTRGAFMQLLPLDEELKVQTKCGYVLIVDTEGLRAPELDSLQTQKHDNELATFVIGLANITLINIYGEVPGDMDDILQTSVHAFLRMNQVKFNPSCHFVHQNAGASIKSEVGRHKFTQKLDKFTADAAKEENCVGRYKTFNDVIAFDDQKNVHHFPALWKGDPPMAPINQGYSDSAQMLKCHLTEVLLEGTCYPGTSLHRKSAGVLHLSLFNKKVESLWKALLQENFVFSFKNTLEITAYNSLETKYGLLESDFRYKMREWRDGVKNLIETTKPPESVPELVNRKCAELHVFINELYESLKKDLNDFFLSSKQSDVLVQWRSKFETKLLTRSQELKEDAMSHCKRLGSSKEAISELDKKNMDYMDIARCKARELMTSLKQERQDQNDNLKKRSLDKSQLRKLLTLDLFTPVAVNNYRDHQLLTESQAENIKRILNKCGVLNEAHLKEILYMLPFEVAKNILKKTRLDEAQLKAHFDGLWIKLITDIHFIPLKGVDIGCAVQEKLIDFVKRLEGKLIHKIQKQCITSENTLVLEVKDGIHFKKIKEKNPIVRFGMLLRDKYRYLRDIADPAHINAQVITNIVLEKAQDYLQHVCDTDGADDFHEDLITELLELLDKEITKESAKCVDDFYFESEYRLDVYLTACQYAVGEFQKMADAFRLKHDPKMWLEAKMKKPLFTTFRNQYYEIEAEEAIASTLCAHIKTPIQQKVENSIGQIMAKQMERAEPHFKSKMALKVKILSDLHDRDNFEDYMLHVTDVEKSYKKWLQRYSVQYCNESSGGCNESRLEIIAKEEVTQLIEIVKNKVLGINEKSIRKWMTMFCEDETLRQEFGFNFEADDVLIDHCEIKELQLESFRDQLKSRLEELKKELRDLFSEMKCESQHVKEKPYKVLCRLAGCTAQCPFCNEQCDWMDHDVKTKKHRVAVHRPQCVTGYHESDSSRLVTTICPANIAGERTFICRDTDNKIRPYHQYQEVYPDWSIEPDPTCEDSLYWMWFVNKYNKDIARKFGPGLQPASVPTQWGNIQSGEAIKKNLRQQYNL